MDRDNYEALYVVVKNGGICSILDAIAHMYENREIKILGTPIGNPRKNRIARVLLKASKKIRDLPLK